MLDDHSVVEPDVLVVLPGGRARIEEKAVFGPPDLLAEVLSTSCPEHDLVRKRRLYEKHGVREYWVLDPATGRAEVYRQETGSRFGRPVVLYADEGETLETPLLPGFAAPLAEVFDSPPADGG